MRKTILTMAALLGIAPAALAASGPLATPFPARSDDASAGDAPQLGAAKTHRKLTGWERRDRAASKRRHAKRDSGPAANVPPQLQAIAQCESGGNPSAVGGGGQFRGKYQFTYATWAAVGGSGDPASAPEAEQDRRAAQLYASSGAGQWPVCSG
jgi:hypothetical protein